jgi:hypothetical protein
MKVSKRENNVTKEEEAQKVVKGDTGIVTLESILLTS